MTDTLRSLLVALAEDLTNDVRQHAQSRSWTSADHSLELVQRITLLLELPQLQPAENQPFIVEQLGGDLSAVDVASP